jgi:hypothetical protein
MSQEKYIGMDVHQATISVAVTDSRGKLIMESILETKAATILEFLQGLHGSLSVTFEEGTSAAWLHDLLKPHVARLVVCDPRKNALLKDTPNNLRRVTPHCVRNNKQGIASSVRFHDQRTCRNDGAEYYKAHAEDPNAGCDIPFSDQFPSMHQLPLPSGNYALD